MYVCMYVCMSVSSYLPWDSTSVNGEIRHPNRIGRGTIRRNAIKLYVCTVLYVLCMYGMYLLH